MVLQSEHGKVAPLRVTSRSKPGGFDLHSITPWPKRFMLWQVSTSFLLQGIFKFLCDFLHIGTPKCSHLVWMDIILSSLVPHAWGAQNLSFLHIIREFRDSMLNLIAHNDWGMPSVGIHSSTHTHYHLYMDISMTISFLSFCLKALLQWAQMSWQYSIVSFLFID